MTRLIILILALAFLFPVAGGGSFDSPLISKAFADEEDDDDDDDDDDSDAGGYGGGNGPGTAGERRTAPGAGRSGSGASEGGSILNPLRRLFGGRQQPQPAPRGRATPPVLFVAGEIVVLNINSEDLQSLLNQGYSILEERSVAGGQRYYRLAVPNGLPLQDARDAVRALPSGEDTDFNHYFRPERDDVTCRGEGCAAYQLVNWPGVQSAESQVCASSGSIGMIDTGINEDHPVFKGAELTVVRLADTELRASKASHGTAVASLLVGQPGTRVPGLLPRARLVAIDAFHRAGQDERADAFTLVEALYNLSDEDVAVVNLSLAGPQNRVVEAALLDLFERQGIAFVAAAGNGGPTSEPVYPAAYDFVLSVTAVDRNKRIFRRANRGEYIDLAAPGVKVWSAASVKGAKWKTGTSFAVPFATSAVALAMARFPEKSPKEIYELLKSKAMDLGDPGHDTTYGAGLLQVGGLC